MVRTTPESRPAVTASPDRCRLTQLSLVSALCVAALLAASGYLAWFWGQRSRPGMTHDLNGISYLSAHQPLKAEQEWIRGIQEDPRDYHCYADLGDYYTALRRYGSAASCYGRAASLHPTDGTLFLREARAEQLLGQPKAAVVAAQKAAALMPGDPEAVGLYGVLEARLHNRPPALAALTRALALDPGSDIYRMARGVTEMDVMDMAAAEQDFQVYLRSHPGDPEASYYLGEIYSLKNRTPQNLRTALQFAERALAGRPGDLRGYDLLGQLYLQSNRPKDALQVFSAGVRLSPDSEAMLKGLADCYNRLGMHREQAAVAQHLQAVVLRIDRIEHLKHVMGFNHNDIAAAMELARLEIEAGEYQQALTYYKQLVRQNPQDMRIRKAAAALYQKMRRPDLAALAMQPGLVP